MLPISLRVQETTMLNLSGGMKKTKTQDSCGIALLKNNDK